MNINKTNYGAWFIDYYDGTLSAEKTAELFLFLEQHPDLKTEFESFNPVFLEPSTAIFEEKELLKKNAITSENIEHYLIAELEHDLNMQDKIKLKDFIANHPSFEKDRALFGMTVLKPGDEVFRGKKDLRRKVIKPFVVHFNVWTAVAAILLITIGVLYINRLEESKGTAEKFPVKNNTVNDSLKDFFKSPDEINSEIKNQKIAESDDVKSNEFKENVQPRPSQEKNYVHDRKKKANDNIATIESIPLAERKEVSTFPVAFNSDPVEAPVYANVSSYKKNEKKENLLDKIDNLKDIAAEKINTVTGEEILYNTATIEDPLADKIPFKSRMLKFAAWALGKISNDKIKMETTLDQSGNIAAYQVSAGKIKYEKDF